MHSKKKDRDLEALEGSTSRNDVSRKATRGREDNGLKSDHQMRERELGEMSEQNKRDLQERQRRETEG